MNKKIEVSPRLQEALREFEKTFDEWSQKNEDEFEKTVETIRGVFNQKGLVLPRNWQEVYFDWYLKTNGEELDKVPFEKFHELMKDRKIILEWANEITKELFPTYLAAEELEKIPHILTLLFELGILEVINQRFKADEGRDTGTNKAKLIGTIIGKTSKEEIEDIRKYLSNIEIIGHPKSPINKTSIKEVSKILIEYGLQVTNL
jgi:hypothetical protein